MKGALTLGLMLLSTGVAIGLYNHKLQSNPTEITAVESGLQGIQHFLNPTQSIILNSSGTPFETFFYVRLALAPRHVALYDSLHVPDTLLKVRSLDNKDTLFASKQVIWEQQIKGYRFQLINLR